MKQTCQIEDPEDCQRLWKKPAGSSLQKACHCRLPSLLCNQRPRPSHQAYGHKLLLQFTNCSPRWIKARKCVPISYFALAIKWRQMMCLVFELVRVLDRVEGAKSRSGEKAVWFNDPELIRQRRRRNSLIPSGIRAMWWCMAEEASEIRKGRGSCSAIAHPYSLASTSSSSLMQ